MNRPKSIRVLMYSHDTYGLGHLTRSVRIARAIRNRYERASILILSGSPVAPYMALPEGADLVKLPSVVKAGPDFYKSRDLNVTFSQIKKIRRDLIRGTAEAFRPHLFLVDNVPLGMKAEILPTLRYLRTARPSTGIVLNLRDILDEPVAMRQKWEGDGVYEVLDQYYDRIFILGDPGIFDATEAYGLPPGKTMHVGYAAPAPRQALPAGTNGGRRPHVLLTVGGGGDGFDFLKRAIEGLAGPGHAQAPDRSDPGIDLEVVTGPLMDPGERRLLERLSHAGNGEIEFHEFVPDLPQRMSRADLVVAMAGYNTCCEIFSHARSALVWPRTTPRIEQFLRAEALQNRGVVSMIPPDETEPRMIAAAVSRALSRGPKISAGDLPEINGLDRLAEELAGLHPALRDPAPRSSGAVGQTADRPSMMEARRVSIPVGWSSGNYWFWPGAGMHPVARR